MTAVPSAIRIGKGHFSGLGKVATKDKDSLANMIRGIAIDLAKAKIQNSKITDFVDNTTGTVQSPPVFADLVIPTVKFDATSAGGASQANFNTATGAFESGAAVIADWLNRIRARIGLSAIKFGDGTITTAGTVPAQTLTVSSVSGTSALDFVDGVAKMTLVKNNMEVLALAANETLSALGNAPIGPITAIVQPVSGTFTKTAGNYLTGGAQWSMAAVAAASASASGASAIAKTVVDTFLGSLANNLATLISAFNTTTVGALVFAALTDSSTGTATTYPYSVTANTTPVAAVGAATTSAPKAGFDTQLAVIANALASLCSRMNNIRGAVGLPLYLDSTGGTVSTTLAAMSSALSAVDGSSGTVALDVVTATARMATIDNALSSLAVGINDLLSYNGLQPIADTGPLGVASTTLAIVAASGTGVGGVTAVTMLNTAVNTWLGNNKNTVASFAAALNAIVGTDTSVVPPLHVVAV